MCYPLVCKVDVCGVSLNVVLMQQSSKDHTIEFPTPPLFLTQLKLIISSEWHALAKIRNGLFGTRSRI